MATDPVMLDDVNLFRQIGQYKMNDIACRAETPGLFVRVATLLEGLAAHCSALAAGCREGRQIATRYHELSQLSGADLARRGITRQSIARAALTDPRSIAR